MINKSNIGKVIQKLRKRKNITQEELAEKIELSTNYLSKVERGLSVLLRTKNITDVFSPEFVFNCKAIFAEKPGPNLRNELAHGLLDDDCINSSIHLYAWWFIFRLVVEANERVQEIIKKRKMQINNSLWK